MHKNARLEGAEVWFILPERLSLPCGVVPLLPNVDDKVDQANLPQTFFDFHFFFSLIRKQGGFWCGYPLYTLHRSFVWGSSFWNTCRQEWKTQRLKERRASEDAYITDSDGFQNKSKKEREALLLWHLCSLKCEMMLQPDDIGWNVGDTETHLWQIAGVQRNKHLYIILLLL